MLIFHIPLYPIHVLSVPSFLLNDKWPCARIHKKCVNFEFEHIKRDKKNTHILRQQKIKGKLDQILEELE